MPRPLTVCGVALSLLAVAVPAAGSAGSPGVRRAVIVDARTGAVDRSFDDTGLDAPAVSDGRSGWFVATARTVGGRRHGGLVHLTRRGHVDRRLAPRLPAGATAAAIVRVGNRLFLSGSFGVEAVSAGSGRRLWRVAFTRNSVTHSVDLPALAATPTAVYAGGAFGTVQGKRVGSVAALDPKTGRLLAWRMPRVGPNVGDVSALAVGGRRLYVGGAFASVGGRPRFGVAAVRTGSGALLPWSPSFGGAEAAAIAVAGRNVLVGGGGAFGAYDARTGKTLRWARRVHGGAAAFGLRGTTAYLGGDVGSGFDRAGVRRRNNLAAFDVATERFPDWGPMLAKRVSVGAISVSRGKLLVTGAFTPAPG